VQHTFDTPDPVSLIVELRSGSLLLRTGDVPRTVVEIPDARADDVDVEQRGDSITVRAHRGGTGFFGGRSQDVAVLVTAPHHTRLVTRLGSADLRVEGRLGESSLHSGSGDVRIEELAGPCLLECGSGDVVVGTVGGALQVKSGSGDVTLDHVGAPTVVSTGSGDVLVTSAHDVVRAKSGSGGLRVREALTDVSLGTASGDLVVDLMHRGQLHARNASGDITVGVPAGVPVWTDISTTTGQVRSDLDGAGEPSEGQDFLELRARTVSGDVHLQQV
jgi:DUF4097 and DUF4098 domain-containing protein YvlB